MKLLKGFNVKGSSIGESVIAMALVAICLAMAITVYGQVISSGMNVSDMIAEQKVKELVWQTEESQLFEDEDLNFETFRIQKRISHKENNGLYEVTFTVLNNGNKHSSIFLIGETFTTE